MTWGMDRTKCSPVSTPAESLKHAALARREISVQYEVCSMWSKGAIENCVMCLTASALSLGRLGEIYYVEQNIYTSYIISFQEPGVGRTHVVFSSLARHSNIRCCLPSAWAMAAISRRDSLGRTNANWKRQQNSAEIFCCRSCWRCGCLEPFRHKPTIRCAGYFALWFSQTSGFQRPMQCFGFHFCF